MADSEKKLNFTFTVEETNGILSALGELPFVKSAAIIQAFQIQAMPQIAEANAKEEAAKDQE